MYVFGLATASLYTNSTIAGSSVCVCYLPTHICFLSTCICVFWTHHKPKYVNQIEFRQSECASVSWWTCPELEYMHGQVDLCRCSCLDKRPTLFGWGGLAYLQLQVSGTGNPVVEAQNQYTRNQGTNQYGR